MFFVGLVVLIIHWSSSLLLLPLFIFAVVTDALVRRKLKFGMTSMQAETHEDWRSCFPLLLRQPSTNSQSVIIKIHTHTTHTVKLCIYFILFSGNADIAFQLYVIRRTTFLLFRRNFAPLLLLHWTSVETPFKHQNVQLGQESMAITFLIHNFHNSRDTSHNTSHF